MIFLTELMIFNVLYDGLDPMFVIACMLCQALIKEKDCPTCTTCKR